MRKITFFGAINFCHPIDGSKYTFVADRISDLFTLLGTLVYQQLLYGLPHPPPLLREYHTEEYSMYEGRTAAEPGITFGKLRDPTLECG